jgi:hypothetical protein
MWFHNNTNPCVTKYSNTAAANVTPMTPAAASNVRPSGLGWEGVTIFGVLQVHASTWIIQSNGHGVQDAFARLCMSEGRPARSRGGNRVRRPATDSPLRTTRSLRFRWCAL